MKAIRIIIILSCILYTNICDPSNQIDVFFDMSLIELSQISI